MLPVIRTWGLVLAGAALLAALVWAALRPDPVPVDLARVAAAPMTVTVNADGRTRIRDIFDVVAPIDGMARRAPVEPGDPVVAGETVVAVVDPAPPALLDPRARAQAEAAAEEAEAALHVAESRLAQAEQELEQARTRLARVQELFARGVVADSTLEEAEQQQSIRSAARDAAQFSLVMAQSALERAEAALLEGIGGAPAAQEECCVRLTAPADGVVLAVDVVSAQPVRSGTRLVSVGDPADLEIVADLLTTDAVRLPAGARAIVERWGGPEALEARLLRIEPQARETVSALGIDEQRVDAVFALVSPPEARPSLGDGFSVFLRIVEWEAPEVAQLPLSALFRDGDGWAVFLREGETVRTVPVRIGRRNDTHAELLAGPPVGAEVVLYPSDALADGVPVIERP